MMGMSIPYESTGRTRQKARTRDAMIAATRAFLGEGVTATVEQAAERAGASRPPPSRSSPTRRPRRVAAYPGLAEESLLGADAPAGARERLEIVTRRMG